MKHTKLLLAVAVIVLTLVGSVVAWNQHRQAVEEARYQQINKTVVLLARYDELQTKIELASMDKQSTYGLQIASDRIRGELLSVDPNILREAQAMRLRMR